MNPLTSFLDALPKMVADPNCQEDLRAELKMFLAEGDKAIGYQHPFIRRAAIPISKSWALLKDEKGLTEARFKSAAARAEECVLTHVRKDVLSWINRKLLEWRAASTVSSS